MDRRGVLPGAGIHVQPLNIHFVDVYIAAVMEKQGNG
jgi:hypothetical protein